MKFLVVGTGSIGRRHVKTVRKNLPGAWVGLVHHRPRAEVDEALASECDELFSDLGAALSTEPDVAIVANATSAHVRTAQACADAGVHLLVEKPISHTLDGVDALVSSCESNGLQLMVGYCLRHHEPLRTFRELIRSGGVGQPFALRAEVGQHLTTWRPDADYRSTITARPELGGGALLELSHEIDYALWILGEVQAAVGFTANLGVLGLDVDEVAEIALRFSSGALGSIHMDLLRSPSTRHCVVAGTEGVAVWDSHDDSIRSYDRAADRWSQVRRSGPVDRQRMYDKQLLHFVACIEGEAAPSPSAEEARRVVELCLEVRPGASCGSARQ